MIQKLSPAGLIGFVALLCFACANEDNSANHLTMDAFAPLPMETAFEFTESKEVAFRFIRSMQVDSHGNVLVNDPSQPVVFMFDGQGRLIQRIGKQGRGPGEFQMVGSILTASERLLVSDGRSLKIEVFEYRDGQYDHVRAVNVENPQLLGNLLGLTEDGIVVEHDIVFPISGQHKSRETAISLLGHEGEVLRDTLFSVPVHEFVTGDSKAPFVAIKIYGNSSQLAFDGESRTYSLWTKALSVDYFTLGGEKHHAFSYPLEPVAVTPAERDSALNQWKGPQRSVMQQHAAAVKPIARNLVVDDQRRVWVELQSEELSRGWYAFSPGGKPMFRINLPHHNAFLQDVHGNNVLWNYTDERGAPTLVMSKIELPEI